MVLIQVVTVIDFDIGFRKMKAEKEHLSGGEKRQLIGMNTTDL
jgi:hypothetical protein